MESFNREELQLLLTATKAYRQAMLVQYYSIGKSERLGEKGRKMQYEINSLTVLEVRLETEIGDE